MILPADLRARISREQLCDVLIHECAHVVRRDPAMRYLQALAGSLFWPLPTVHLVNRRLDRRGKRFATITPSLAASLLNMPKLCCAVATLVGRSGPALAVVGILPGRGKLESRIAGLIDARRDKGTRTSRAGVALWLSALIVASTAICGMTIREAQSENPAPAETEKVVPPQAANDPDELSRAALAEAQEIAAAVALKLSVENFKTGQAGGPEEQYVWSRRLMDAQIASNPSPAGRLRAADAHATRMNELKGIAHRLVEGGAAANSAVAMAEYYCAEAAGLFEAAKRAAGAKKSATAPVGPVSAENFVVTIPSAEGLLEIENGVVEGRRKIRSGRVVAALYQPGQPGTMQFLRRYAMFFDGEKRRADWIVGKYVLHRIWTPTSFIRWGGDDHLELLFQPQTPHPNSVEVPDARLLGLVTCPVDSISQFGLDTFFSHRDRENLEITSGVDQQEPVLKVSYQFENKAGHPVSVEYWLAPRCGNLPVYYACSSKIDDRTNSASLRVKLAYHPTSAVWFPSEVVYRHEPGGFYPEETVRIEEAEFDVEIDDSTFLRSGLEVAG